ncbi:MAG: aldehyde dehydrogenase family protein, partial [Planctomycetota bacterium]
RGLFVRRLADELRDKRELLGELVSLETGKIASEGVGEVQEAVDIADYAVGLSRMIGGLTLPSERPGHELQERWRPLGPVGVVTAFNFPAAVWAWNAMLAFVCGDAVVWKPSLRSPLTAVALQTIVQRCAEEMDVPAVGQLVVGTDEEAGEPLVADRRLPLISATGSCAMGRRVGEIVAKRLGRALLELGGNNAAIVLADADMELALRAVLFGAVGTAGQRCTTTRRLLVHRSVADRFVDRLAAAYRSLVVGDPMDPRTHVGPLITAEAVERMQRALALAVEQGGEVVVGGAALQGPGHYVEPAIVRAPASGSLPIALEETFAPILYVFAVDSLDEAIARNNEAAQGLSSAIFTRDLRSAERFLSEVGSDCGIANVNTGTSGAEIGGAFGGEKETGGGREAGSDAWKAYMRRQTCAINFSDDLPLAQGVSFGV